MIILIDEEKGAVSFVRVNYVVQDYSKQLRNMNGNFNDQENINYFLAKMAEQKKIDISTLIKNGIAGIYPDLRVEKVKKRIQQEPKMVNYDTIEQFNDILNSKGKRKPPKIQIKLPSLPKITYRPSRKVIITFIVISTTLVVAAAGYTLGKLTDKKAKATRALTKLEQSGYDNLKEHDIKDLVGYIDSEMDDSLFQKDEIELNNRVLCGLIRNDEEERVISRAQTLFMNCFENMNIPRMPINPYEVEKYFRYMSDLFMDGDELNGINCSINATQVGSIYSKNSKISEDKVNESVRNLASSNKIDYDRVRYGGMKLDATVLKRMSPLAQKILREQYLGLCQKLSLNQYTYSKPSWWHKVGSFEKLFEEVEAQMNENERQITDARYQLNSSTGRKK